MSIDLSKLSPAPWTYNRRYSNGCETVPRIHCPKDENRECGWVADLVGAPYLGYESTLVNAEFIALARNAFDIKVRHKWFAVPCPAGWVAARLFPDVEKDNSASWTLAIPQVIVCADPETAIVEAEAWAIAHPADFKQYDDWQNNVVKEFS